MIKNLLLNIAVGFLPTTMFAQNSILGYSLELREKLLNNFRLRNFNKKV